MDTFEYYDSILKSISRGTEISIPEIQLKSGVSYVVAGRILRYAQLRRWVSYGSVENDGIRYKLLTNRIALVTHNSDECNKLASVLHNESLDLLEEIYSKGNATFDEIYNDSPFSPSIVEGCLNELVETGLVLCNRKRYYVNTTNKCIKSIRSIQKKLPPKKMRSPGFDFL